MESVIEDLGDQIKANLQIAIIVSQAPEELVDKCSDVDHGRVIILSAIAFATKANEAESMQELLAQHPRLQETLATTLNQETSFEDIYRENDDTLFGRRFAVDCVLTN